MTQAGMPSRTAEVFKALTNFAKDGKTPTYGEVGKIAGVYHRQVRQRLYAIWQWCDSNGHPHLNAIVVNAQTRRSGMGYTPSGHQLSDSEFQTMREQVFAYNWDSVRFPGALL